MSVPSQNDFLYIIKSLAENSKGFDIQTAIVTSITGDKAVIRFDGEDTPSQKIYKAFTSYSPVVGDRVMLINGIIIGGWGHD